MTTSLKELLKLLIAYMSFQKDATYKKSIPKNPLMIIVYPHKAARERAGTSSNSRQCTDADTTTRQINSRTSIFAHWQLMKTPYEMLARSARTYGSKLSHQYRCSSSLQRSWCHLGLTVSFGTLFFENVSVDSELMKCTLYFIGAQDSEKTFSK